MRYSRMSPDEMPKPKSEKTGKGFWAIVFIIVAAAAVYFIGAAKVGAFISDKVVTPVIALFTKSDDDKVKETSKSITNDNKTEDDKLEENEKPAGVVKKDIKMNEFNTYFLQIGAYSDSENAQKSALEMKEKGCAGYVFDDGERFRVFIAGYTSRKDAEDVKARIAEDYSMETKVYEMSTPSKNITVETDEEVSENIEKALSKYPEYLTELMSVSQKYDKKSMSASEAHEKISSTKIEVDKTLSDLKEYSERTDSEFVLGMYKAYETMSETLLGLEADMTDIKFSAEIKAAFIAGAVSYNTLSASV